MKSSSEQSPSVGTLNNTTSAHICQEKLSGRKWCPRHRGWKDKSEFYANKQTSDGLDPWCIPCRRTYTNDWYRDNIEQSKGYRSQAQDTEAKARHRAKHPDRHYARCQLLKARENGLHLDRCVWPGCAATEKIQGHHPSYEKPHEIVSLCLLHHKATDLLGDKLGFTLPTVDISPYLKKSKRMKPSKAKLEREAVSA